MSKKKKENDGAKLIFSKSLQEVEKSSKKKKKAKKKKKGEKKTKETMMSKCKIKQTTSVSMSYKDAIDSDEKVFFVSPKGDVDTNIGVRCVVKTANNSLVDITTGESIASIAKRHNEKEWRDAIVLYPSSITTEYTF